MENQIRFGWGSADISTEAPLNLPGQFHMRISKGILDPLTVTALAVENNGCTLMLISADLIDCRCGLLDRVKEELRERLPQVPSEAVILSATHTHTGASHTNGYGAISFPPDEPFYHEGVEIASSAEYREFLISRICDAACRAYETLAPGGMAYGYGFAVVGMNRRVYYFDDLSLREGNQNDCLHGVNGHVKMYGNTADPSFSHYEGGMDPFVNLMFTFDGENRLTGAIVNVPCPSQCSETEEMLSADYWHDVRQAVRARYGDIFLLPQCAAAGDLSPRQLHYKKAQERRLQLKFGEARADLKRPMNYLHRKDLAERIAACFDEVYAWAKKEVYQNPIVSHQVKTVMLPTREISQKDYENALAQYEAAENTPFVTDGTPLENLDRNSRLMSTRGRYYKIIQKVEKRQEKIPMEIHTFRIGPIAFTTNRFELFLDYQHRIQARSPFLQTFVVQLTAQSNSDNGTYLPTQRALEGRGFGASIYDNLVTPEAGQIIVEESLSSLEELWQEKE